MQDAVMKVHVDYEGNNWMSSTYLAKQSVQARLCRSIL